MASNEVLVKLRADVSNLKQGLSTAMSQIENLSGTTEKQMGKMSSALSGIGKAVAGAFAVTGIVNFGKTVVSTTSEFSDSMKKVQALTGATDGQFKTLQETAIKLGSTTAHSSSAVSEAMGYMALAGFNTDQILQGLNGTLALSSAGQLDLATTSDILTDTMSMFSMKAEECSVASDVFAKVQASSNTSVAQLGEAMKYAGATASAFGLDIQQTSALLGVMADNGIKASMGGTALKSILSRLASPTADVNKGFQTLGFSTQEVGEKCKDLGSFLPEIKARMEGLTEAQQVQVAKQIAGSEAMSGFLAIVKGSSDSLPALTEALYNCGGYAQETADKMESGLGGAIRGLKSAWEGFILKIGTKLEAPAVEVVKALTECISNIIPAIENFWAKYGELIKTLAVSVGTFLAVKTAILGVVAVVSAMKTFLTAVTMVKSLSGAFAILKFSISSLITCNPVVLAVAGVIAVIGGLAYLIVKNWEGISAFFKNLWEGICSAFSSAWESISSTVSGWCSAVADVIKNIWNGIKSFFSTIWEAIVGVVRTYIQIHLAIIQTVFTAIKTVIMTILTAIKDIIVGTWERICTYLSPIIEGIRALITFIWQGIQLVLAVILTVISGIIIGAWNFIKTAVEVVVQTISDVITTVWTAIKDFFSPILEAISTAISTAWNFVKETTVNVFNAVKDFFVGLWTAIVNFIVPILESIKNNITTAWNNVKAVTTSIFNAVKGVVVSVWNGISSAISNVVNGISSAVSNGFNAVKNTTSSIFNSLKSIVMNIWNGIGGGIQSVVNGIIGCINGMIRAMNKIHFDVPDWVPVMGGKSFGFSIPEISQVSWFASGGIIKGTEGGTIVGVGEAGDEAIVPLSNKSRMKPFAEAVAGMIVDTNKGTNEGNITNNFTIGSLVVREEADIKKIAEQLYKMQERNRRMRGVY